MNKFLKFSLLFLTLCQCVYAQKDVIDSVEIKNLNLNEVLVSSLYNPLITSNNVIISDNIIKNNYGQEPSNLFSKLPSIISTNDNGTEFGYGYFRIRGLDQTRINVTIDGCPWNEAEDYGAYFANSPDLFSSLNTIKIDKGVSSGYNGVASVAGGIILESVNLYTDSSSYAYFGGGSFGSMKSTIVYNMGNVKGWGLHIKATHQQTNGYREHSFNKSEALTVKFGYKFTETSNIDFLSINGYHRNGQGWIGNSLEELSVNPFANGNTENETDNWFMSMNRVQYKHKFTKTILLASVYYQFQDGSYRFDLDNYNKRMVGIESVTNKIYDYGLTHHMIGANINAKHYLNNIDISYGLNGYRFIRKHFMDNECVNISADEYYDNIGYKTDLSIYTRLTYKPIKQLLFSGNVQYRHAEFAYHDNVTSSLSFSSQQYNTLWDFFNFGFSMEYIPTNVLKIYGKFNQVNREPTRSDMFGGNESFCGELTTIVPEIANDVEVGVEYKNERFYANINLYYMFFYNELILNGNYGPNGLPCHENAKQSSRKGLELSTNWNFVTNWNFKASFSYSNNTIETDTFGKKNHVLTPDFTFDGDIFYENKSMNVGVNVNYRSEMFVNIENTNTIPYLLTLNAYASYKFKNNFEIGGKINNITNKVNYCTGAVGPNGETLYFRNASTNFNIFIKYNF